MALLASWLVLLCTASALLSPTGDGVRASEGDSVARGGPQCLWNGVCLPPTWPPNTDLNRSAVVPPYLSDGPPHTGSRPASVNVSIGRQLFVDDFLIENKSGVKTGPCFRTP